MRMSRGHSRGYEGQPFEIVVERIEPERLFSFRWHPFAVEEGVDYSDEPTTLVVFALEEVASGILLTVTESGFDQNSAGPAGDAFTANNEGWRRSCRSSRISCPGGVARRPDSELAGPAAVFWALGDETRLRLVSRLSDEGPMSIAKLTVGFAMTRQAITKHLRVMRHAGLVRRTQQGRESVWKLEQRRLAEARRHLQSISAQWDETLQRLKAMVER